MEIKDYIRSSKNDTSGNLRESSVNPFTKDGNTLNGLGIWQQTTELTGSPVLSRCKIQPFIN